MDPTNYKTMAELKEDLAENAGLSKVVVLNEQNAIVANLSLLSANQYYYRQL